MIAQTESDSWSELLSSQTAQIDRSTGPGGRITGNVSNPAQHPAPGPVIVVSEIGLIGEYSAKVKSKWNHIVPLSAGVWLQLANSLESCW
jgi:hypothetical protein